MARSVRARVRGLLRSGPCRDGLWRRDLRLHMTEVLAIELRLVRLPLVRPFRTSFGEDRDKECILVRIKSPDAVGWGECVAGHAPGYSEEFNEGAWSLMREFLAPSLLAAGDISPERVAERLARVRGHRMAKAAFEAAVLDADLRARDESLAGYLGGTQPRVPVGVSVGITETVDELLEQVAGYVSAGYRRVKLKIEPGFDVRPVSAVREAHPGVPISVDANAAYSMQDLDTFAELDALGLVMIEQPFSREDLVEHAKLQQRIETPICLDESIRSAADANAALELGACRIINVKPGRVGGLLEACRVHDAAVKRDVPVWCGGMLETGIGRAANLALASLPGFTLPGDISASSRYFEEDLTDPFEVAPDGTMAVPDGPGIGVEPHTGRLEAATVRLERIGEE